METQPEVFLPQNEDVLDTDAQTAEIDSSDTKTTRWHELIKTTIAIREDPQSVYQFVRKHKNGGLLSDPDFQRDLVWKHKQKSRFIESILLNFPIPPLYVNEQIDGKWAIIDGRQRTTTLIDFLNNGFELKGLEALEELNGKKFGDLPEALQARIEDKKIIIYILQSNTPIEVVYELFDRINTGGTPLNRQEVRNCIFIGKSTRLLKELAEKPYFQKAIDYGVSPQRMKDREVILRYIAFRIMNYEQDYVGDLSKFVESAMIRINKMQDEELDEIRKDFERVMIKTYDFFGNKNFRYPAKNGKGEIVGRGFINTSVMESVCYFFSKKTDEFLDNNKHRIVQNFAQLLQHPEYVDAVRFSTGTKFRVINRFQLVEQILGNIE